MKVATRPFVIERLRALRSRPQMFAYTREAFAAQVALLLELIGVDTRLVWKPFQVPSTCMADTAKLVAEVDDDWARAFVDDAAKLVGLELS